MPTVPCPECGTEVIVRAGGRAKCPECGGRVRAEDGLPTLELAEDDSSPEERPRRPGRRPRARGDSRVPCPECGSRWIRKGPWSWYLGTVGAIVCKAVECQECGHEFDLYKPQANLAKRKLNLAIGINAVGLVGIIIVLTMLFLFIRATMKP
jgi:DNA-directed RNA polymerase subunit RPC12/RpoP